MVNFRDTLAPPKLNSYPPPSLRRWFRNYVTITWNMNKRTTALLVPFTLLIATIAHHVRADYKLDDSVGLGRVFDRIGGLSGGGVSHVMGGPHADTGQLFNVLLKLEGTILCITGKLAMSACSNSASITSYKSGTIWVTWLYIFTLGQDNSSHFRS